MQIHDAARYGQAKELEPLIKSGVDVNTRNIVGQTPLHLAVTSGCLLCVKILVKNGADVNVQDGSGRTPFLDALKNSEAETIEIIQYLLDHGADVRGENGEIALLEAATRGRRWTAKTLIERGVDVNCEDYADVLGSTPLLGAVSAGNITMVKLLLKKGADANMAPIDGEPPLALANANILQSQRIADLLKQHGAKDEGTE